MSKRRTRRNDEPAALPATTRLLPILLIPLGLVAMISLLVVNQVNDFTTAEQATATAVATRTTAAINVTQLELAGAIASRAIDVHARDVRHGLLLAVEAYNLVPDETQIPAAVRHAIWQVLAQSTSKTITGTLALDTAVPNRSSSIQWLVTSGETGELQLWPLHETLPVTPTLQFESTSSPQNLIVSPTGRWLVTYGNSSQAQLWDLESNLAEPYRSLTISSTVKLASFGPQAKWLALSGETDTAVFLWAFRDNELEVEPHRLQPQTDRPTDQPVRHLAFDTEAQWLAATHTSYFNLWDLTALPGIPPIHVDVPKEGYQFTAVSFSTDGNWLIATSQKENAHPLITLWHLDLKQLVADACATANSNFSEQEWRQYFPTRPYANTCTP